MITDKELKEKAEQTRERIKDWYEAWDGQVYTSFSGGKDSTLLLHLAREVHPNIPGVFADTGLEAPEIRDFVKSYSKITWLKPNMHFTQVISQHGYPVISKKTAEKVERIKNPNKSPKSSKLHLIGIRSDGAYKPSNKIQDKWKFLIHAPFKISPKCCEELKKKPFHKFEKETNSVPIIGMTMGDSEQRKKVLVCNRYDTNHPTSNPLYDWKEEEILHYLKIKNIPLSSIYNMGWKRTGCMFCMFGIHMEDTPNRFQKMYYTHPKLWKYCIYKLGIGEVLRYIGIDYFPHKPISEFFIKSKTG